jgi:Peptidase family M23
MKILYTATILLLHNVVFGQTKIVDVTYSQNTTNEVAFQYSNLGYCDYALKLEFSDLRGGDCSCMLPFVQSVKTGMGSLLTLKPTQPNQGVTFRFSYKYTKGRLLNKPPKTLMYLLPFSNTKAHRAQQTQNIIEMLGGQKITNFYGTAFEMQHGDTIYASRRGVVSEVKNEFEKYNDNVWFSSQTNSVEVFHQDGTFGRYNRFKKGTILVKEGQSVEAGQPLGVVADDTFENTTVMQFTVYYLAQSRAFKDDNHPFEYVIPVFCSKDTPNGAVLQQNALYESQWPEAVITQEMSKRELKKWKQ